MPLHLRTARRLERDLRDSPPALLPSITALSRTHGVSRSTMARAASELRSKGVLEFCRGSKIRVVAATSHPSPARLTAVERLFLRLRGSVQDGTYEVGEALPKAQYLASIRRVSTHTVTGAYALLVEQGFAHRRGKQVLAGPAPAPQRFTVRSPVICVVGVHSRAWRALCESSWMADFGRRFAEQADSHGIRIVQAVSDETRPEAGTPVPAGLSSVHRYLGELGERLLGVLIAVPYYRMPDLQLWIDTFAALGKPVLWFDWSGGAPAAVGSAVRCHTDTEAAHRLVVEALVAYGHRRIAYQFDPDVPWQRERYEALARCASTNPHKPAIIPLGQHDTARWDDPGAISRDLDVVYRSGSPPLVEALRVVNASPFVRNASWFRKTPRRGLSNPLFEGVYALSYRQFRASPGMPIDDRRVGECADLIWESLHFLPLFTDKEVTALVVRHDRMAESYFRWFSRIGIRVPESISVISFDNANKYSYHPLTTIDFGFRSLGYQAFHAIAGIVPVPRDRRQSILGTPFLVDRGSVGPPRRTGSIFAHRAGS